MKTLMKKKKTTNYSGLTLMELIIAIAILVMLLLVSVGLFASYAKARSAIKKNEQAAEEASLIVDEMAKKLRMSNCDYNTDSTESPPYGISFYNDDMKECFLGSWNLTFNEVRGCDFSSQCTIRVRSNVGDKIISYVFDNGFNYGSGPEYKLREIDYNINDGTQITDPPLIIADHVKGSLVVRNSLYTGNIYSAGDWRQLIPLFQIKLLKMGNDDDASKGVLIETAVSQRGGYDMGTPYTD